MATTQDPIDWSGKSILLVDDEPFMITLVERMLRDMGVSNVQSADNGETALQKCQNMGNDIDAVIIDLEMPVMNGLEFLQKLRSALPPVKADVPAVVLTGHAEAINVKKAVKLGIHGYMVKPMSRNIVEQNLINAVTNAPIPTDTAKRI